MIIKSLLILLLNIFLSMAQTEDTIQKELLLILLTRKQD